MSDNTTSAAVIAAQLAQEIGLPAGNLWEPVVARTIAGELENESRDKVEERWRFRLGLARQARVSKRLAKAQRGFRRRVIEFLMSEGVTVNEFWRRYDYTLATPIGDLWLSIHENWIACMFDDVKAGRDFSGCSNPYSGKWNWHYDEATIDDPTTLAYFQSEIKRLKEIQR